MISVIVPIYNIEKYVGKCIDSIISQTYADIEVLLIDDGSTDSCGMICDNYALKDDRIRVIHKKNEGLVSAWKEGVRLAKGELICFIDGDDFVDKDYLQELYNAIDDCDIVCSHFTRYWEDNKVLKVRTNLFPAGRYECDQKLYDCCVSNYGNRSKMISNNRCTKLCKADLVKRCSVYCTDDVSFGEDYQMTVCMLLNATSVKVIDCYKYYYRCNPTSIVNTYKKDLWEKTKHLFKTISKMPKLDKINNYEKQIRTEILLYFVGCLKNEYYFGKLDRATFNRLSNDDVFIDAVQDYYSNDMWSLDKILIKAAKKNKFHAIRSILWWYRLYCQIRGVDYL